jgi:hypothetical protein
VTTPHFPAFRKLVNDRSVFRIDSATAFTEVQRIGARYAVFSVEATTWPERLRIADMLAAEDGSVEACAEADFEAWLTRAQGPV